MKYEQLLNKVSDLPYFTTSFLAADEKLVKVRLQLARWVKDRRVIKLHKGTYTLAQPYRKIDPEPFVIANILKSPSYVSLQSALSWYGLIPEFVPVTTSISTVRPQIIDTPTGRLEYRHVEKKLFWGYKKVKVSEKQEAFVATAEKALLDMVYLTGGGDSREFLEELRLQNFENIDVNLLRQYAEKTGRPKLNRAVLNIKSIIAENNSGKL